MLRLCPRSMFLWRAHSFACRTNTIIKIKAITLLLIIIYYILLVRRHRRAVYDVCSRYSRKSQWVFFFQ